jgi:hypothetical protein
LFLRLISSFLFEIIFNYFNMLMLKINFLKIKKIIIFIYFRVKNTLKATIITLTNITIIGYCYLSFIHVNFSFNYPFLLLPLDASSNSLAMHPRFYSKILPLRGPTKETWKDDLLSNESRNLDSSMEIPSLEKFDDKIDTINIFRYKLIL